jgi:hypothetical protein
MYMVPERSFRLNLRGKKRRVGVRHSFRNDNPKNRSYRTPYERSRGEMKVDERIKRQGARGFADLH